MKPGERFSSRVDDYQKYRPDYPQSLVTEIIKQSGLDDSAVIADFGSGTGIFTRRLLQAGFEVYAVEPNREMRVAAESTLAAEPGFTSIDGSAEDSRLESASIDLITAAQAFHWFNTDTAKQEFRRVLKPQGQLALIWNKRKLSQPFQQAYDAILREFAPEYGKVNHMNLSEMDMIVAASSGTRTSGKRAAGMASVQTAWRREGVMVWSSMSVAIRSSLSATHARALPPGPAA